MRVTTNDACVVTVPSSLVQQSPVLKALCARITRQPPNVDIPARYLRMLCDAVRDPEYWTRRAELTVLDMASVYEAALQLDLAYSRVVSGHMQQRLRAASDHELDALL